MKRAKPHINVRIPIFPKDNMDKYRFIHMSRMLNASAMAFMEILKIDNAEVKKILKKWKIYERIPGRGLNISYPDGFEHPLFEAELSKMKKEKWYPK